MVDLVHKTGAYIIWRNRHTVFSVTLYLRSARKYIFLYSALIKDYSLFVMLEAICIFCVISRCFQQWSDTANSPWHIGWKEVWNTRVWLQDKFKVHVVCGYIMYCMFLMGTGSVGSHKCKKLDKQSSRSYSSDYAIIYIH